MAEEIVLPEGPAIGIDLGTTFSRVAVVRNGKVEVIIGTKSNNTMPSIVAFKNMERFIGESAKDQLATNPANTVFNAKRLIGRQFHDPIVQKCEQQLSFKVVEEDKMPKIPVEYLNKFKRFSAEEISAVILGKLKEIAESYLNAKVTNAVVSVPACFNDMQRKATIVAARIAGLNVLRIINEPTAAAIAYGMDIDRKKAKNTLVYDLGGGTFDASIVKMYKDGIKVRATAGNSHLGGEDFNRRIMESLGPEIERNYDINIYDDQKVLQNLRTKVEQAKRILSVRPEASIETDLIYRERKVVVDISRNQFDRMCADLFESTITIVKRVLKDANMQSKDIDTIVLVGGSTRIPKIQQLLRELFPGKEICRTKDAVAHGAAIQAAILHSDGMKNMQIKEVTAMTVGTDVDENCVTIMSPMIERNTRIPVSKSQIYTTRCDDQAAMRFSVLQGEHRLAKDNFEIGKYTVEGIPPAPGQTQKVNVTFSIDENGILTVRAESKAKRNTRGKLTIENDCGCPTNAEINRMVADAAKYRKQDQEAKDYKAATLERAVWTKFEVVPLRGEDEEDSEKKNQEKKCCDCCCIL